MKIICLLLSAVLAFQLCACAGKKTKNMLLTSSTLNNESVFEENCRLIQNRHLNFAITLSNTVTIAQSELDKPIAMTILAWMKDRKTLIMFYRSGRQQSGRNNSSGHL